MDIPAQYAEQDAVVQKLKHLDSRLGALSYIVKNGSEKLAHDTVFIRTKSYDKINVWSPEAKKSAIRLPKIIDVELSFEFHGEIPRAKSFRIMYLGEEVFNGALGSSKINNIVEGKEYTLEILSSSGKVLLSKGFLSRKEVRINI